VLGIGGDGAQGLGGDLEEQAINELLVVVADCGDGCRQGEDDVVILHGQQVSLAIFEPAQGSAALALGAMRFLQVMGCTHYVPYGEHSVTGSADDRPEAEGTFRRYLLG